ncbi:hypothetical protein Dda_1070 [Drechslerella dactyloides]|uniref:TauD/TfdA-like domain-containing protein n=1 Tax=Drechslerella dactyloides TaxID=74499 RepID=A0AAD6J6N6_DREDA|nr:hypothetical protein Dda_1070 [Drechslerella dactyloides]
MAPLAVSGEIAKAVLTGHKACPEPIRFTGTVDNFKSEDATPVISTEFPEVNIVNDIINAPNADELLRDLAVITQSSLSTFSGRLHLRGSLRLVQLPTTGGDTLWASGYELYDRLSKPYQQFRENLTATHIGSGLHDISKAERLALYDKPRGNPQNVGLDLTAVHPIC